MSPPPVGTRPPKTPALILFNNLIYNYLKIMRYFPFLLCIILNYVEGTGQSTGLDPQTKHTTSITNHDDVFGTDLSNHVNAKSLMSSSLASHHKPDLSNPAPPPSRDVEVKSSFALSGWEADETTTLHWRCPKHEGIRKFEIWLLTELEKEPLLLQVFPFIQHQNSMVNFEIRDLLLVPGKNRYQVRMIHNDGSISDSQVCAINSSTKNLSKFASNDSEFAERLKLLTVFR